MRAIVLGAGASHHACYPLASSLLARVEEHVKCSKMVNIKKSWSKWVSFRDSCPDYLQLVVRNNNPEIVFTLPTLLQIAVDAEDPFQLRQAVNEAQTSRLEEQVEKLQKYHDSPGHKFLTQAKRGLSGLLNTLDWFFRIHHSEDRQDENRSRREPLRKLLSLLQPGDIIITLNWDTTAERTLTEIQKWSPIQGYGFQKDLVMRLPDGQDSPVPDQAHSSAVTVLKLHGSFGWYTAQDNVFFDNSYYLRNFDFYFDGQPFCLADPSPSSYGGDQLLVTPSFIKNLNHPILVKVWNAAHSALEQAETVDVWGYSLPEADGAARALFLALKARLNSGKVHVTVHDPCNATRKRWLHFLGDLIHTKDEGLGSPCSTELA